MKSVFVRVSWRLPIALLAVAAILALPALSLGAGILAAIAAVLSAASALAGALIERWLFFAEAKHAVTLYYGTAAI